MPYEIQKQGKEFCVVKKGGGKSFGCHPSEDKAKAQMRALYAQESEGDLPVKVTVAEVMPAIEAVWTENAEGLPEADVVIIRPGESVNRREYPREALQQAVNDGFWDNNGHGTPMFVDHGNKAAPRARSVRDLVAKVLPGSTYVGQEGEVRGRVQFINADFAKTVKNAGKSVGLSAVTEFLGTRHRGNDGHMHERVHKLVANHSLDFVAFPAAGGGVEKFLPAMESEGEVDWSRLTDSDWEQLPEDLLRQKRPDMLAAAEADDQGGDDDDKKDDPTDRPDQRKQMIALEAVQPYIKEQVDLALADFNTKQVKQAETRTKVRELVARSGLKPLTQADILSRFDGQESYDEPAVQAAIEHEAAKLKEAGLSGPVVKGMGDSSASLSDDSVAAADKPWAAFESQMEYTPLSGGKKDASNDAGKVN